MEAETEKDLTESEWNQLLDALTKEWDARVTRIGLRLTETIREKGRKRLEAFKKHQ